MSAAPRGDAGGSCVVGIRTRNSDTLQWAVWSGDGPAKPGAWVRVVTDGELGQLVVAPGKAFGLGPLGSLPRVVAHLPGDEPECEEEGSGEQPPAPGTSVWGRIGRPPDPGSTLLGTDGSTESTRYRELKAAMPPLGSRVVTPAGEGSVIASNVFSGTLTVRLDATSEEVEIVHRLPDDSRSSFPDRSRPRYPEGA